MEISTGVLEHDLILALLLHREELWIDKNEKW